MTNNTINILGVNISALEKQEVLKKIEQFLVDKKQHQIVTPNPEFILNARQDEEFFYILNSADLAVPDGIGLKFAAWAMGRNLYRFAGADLVKEILKIAEGKNLKVGIINWNGGLSNSENIKYAIKRDYSGLQILAADVDRELRITNYELRIIIDFKPDILFCALGAPYQEKWIYHNLKNLPSVKIAIGVGGAFDFMTGKIKRAPKLFRAVGLEWLWRLILEPRYRFKRIYNAVIIFPLLFIKWRFILPFLYRPNVVCILYRSVLDATEASKTLRYEILLVQRSDQENHWQMPQGGTDGESIKKAGERELKEELGADKFKIVKTYKNIFSYRFNDELSKFKVYAKLASGYKGQKQSLCIAEFLGSDSDIKINFWEHKNWKWVNAENLINEVHPVRRESAEVFMEKFKNSQANN